MSTSRPPSTEEQFGRYLLLETIGKGGMAEVFRAVSHGVEGFQRVFVIKRILKEKSASKEFIEMFVNEARISALLNHPNIVQIYDFGQISGSYFLTMEYLRGKDLLALLRQLRNTNRPMPPEVAAYIAQQVAQGLHYAHSLTQSGGKSLNIVHRDVSPSNVMLLRAGGVKLLDFGIAKATTSFKSQSTTQVGLLKGKLSYLSPEQINGQEIDGRSDIFSLGVVLWECLTGKRLFFDKTDYDTMKNVLERPIPPPSTQRFDIPPALDFIVIRALERDLDRRYASAKMLADELDTFLQEMHFSAGAIPRLLDDVFGEDSQQVEAQIPARKGVPEEDHHARPSESPARASASIPAVSVGGSSRERGAGRPGSQRRLHTWVAATAAALVLLAFVMGFVFRRASTPAAAVSLPVQVTPPQQAALASPPPRAPSAASAEVIPPAVNEPAAAMVTVKIDSDPEGAQIEDEGGTILGTTPAILTLPRSATPRPLTLKREGYEAGHPSIIPDRDVSALVTLRTEIHSLPAKSPLAKPATPVRHAPLRKTAQAPHHSDGKVKEALSIDPFAEAQPARSDK